MAVRHEEVDFLIVTALREETEAVRDLLEEKTQLTHDVMGKISRDVSTGKYVVALTEIGGMGTDVAQAVAREAFGRLNPKRVILTGIAAGFPEAGVNLGDILVPDGIVPYELAKVTEKLGNVEYKHRGLAINVSYGLWHAANTLSMDPACRWADAIKEQRPDGTNEKPVVHSRSLSVLGCGDKVVATKFAEARKWLLKEYSRQAIGLEMESYGVLTACRMTDKPFLAVKSSQDPATAEKDDPSEKDLWRVYAAQAAAAFTTALIRRFELRYTELVEKHMREMRYIAQSYERYAPQPPFPYKVSLASSYALLKEGVYDLPSDNPSILIPNDAVPMIALHGGGGTGKTRIVRSLIGSLIEAGLYPVFVDLRKYSSERRYRQDGEELGSIVQNILLSSSAPRRTKHELERLAREGSLVLLIDGLNEVSKEARTMLIDSFQGLHREGTCYMLVTDRFGSQDSLEAFSHATVERLDFATVLRLFDSVFGAGSFGRLNKRLQMIYRRPFFLSLALKSKQKFAGERVWSGIFQEFFLNQLRMPPDQLDTIARATLKAFDEHGIFGLNQFKKMMNAQIYQALVEAEVLGRTDSGFEHHLWRDYLVSRYLAQNKDEWKDSVFDAVTTFSSSLECLSLTVEQMPDRAQKDTFLKRVFDWNYLAVAHCIADFREDDPAPRQLSLSIRSAILGAIAEKRFDVVQRTRQRAEEFLSNHRYDFARPFVDAETREALSQHVAGLSGLEDWFKRWKTLFTKGSGERFGSEEIDLIASNDSLIGWTAANLGRRSIIDEVGQYRIRKMYKEVGNAEDKKSVRWRIVHVLGAFPNASNVNLLLEALTQDPYHWVQYGAARGLIEIASKSEEDLREQALSSLNDFVRNYNPANVWLRRLILREIVEVAFIRNPPPRWKDAVVPTLELIVEKETERPYRDTLSRRIIEFRRCNEGN